MDITAILTILSPYLKTLIGKGLEEFSGEAGKSLWTVIKKPFTSAKDIEVVAAIEDDPYNQENQQRLMTLLRDKIKHSPAYLDTLKKITYTFGNHTMQVNQYGDKSMSIRDNFGNINID